MATPGTRTLLRTTVLGAALTVLLSVSTRDARANQSGPDVNAINQAKICQAAGGKATIYVDRTVGSGMTGVDVSCHGGLLGGLVCENTAAKTTCGIYRIQSEEESHVAPAAGAESIESGDPVLDELVIVGDVPAPDEAVASPSEEAGQDDAIEPADEGIVTDAPTVSEEPATLAEHIEPTTGEAMVAEPAPVDTGLALTEASVEEAEA